MNNEITVNDHKETLEACLTDTLWIENEEIQGFCRDMFKRHEARIVEVEGVSTGGGFYHLLFRLDDGHLIVTALGGSMSFPTTKSVAIRWYSLNPSNPCPPSLMSRAGFGVSNNGQSINTIYQYKT